MPTSKEAWRVLRADPERYAAYRLKMRAGWKRYAKRHNVSEVRSERYFRLRAGRQSEECEIRRAGQAIVTARTIATDLTYFQSDRANRPTQKRRNALAQIADEILAAGEVSTALRAELDNYQWKEIERCPKKKRGTPTSPKPTKKQTPQNSAP